MDIKSALNAILPIQRRENTAVDRTIKSGGATDRDANGQMGYDQQKKRHRDPMTEDQLKKAIEALQALPAVKENNLTVEMAEHDGRKIILLKEPSGKLLRRITEEELWTLPEMKDSDPHAKGQLLNRTA